MSDNELRIPRRNYVDKMCAAELKIREAMEAVECMGADPRLTDAVVLLGEAKESVADFIDGVERKPSLLDKATERIEELEKENEMLFDHHQQKNLILVERDKQISYLTQKNGRLVEALKKIADALPPNALSMVAGKALAELEGKAEKPCEHKNGTWFDRTWPMATVCNDCGADVDGKADGEGKA